MQAINTEIDELIPLGELARQRLGKRISPTTLWRWKNKGANGARLSCVKSGNRWMSTRAAFAEFLREQTQNCTPAPMGDDAPNQRSAATTAKLKSAGLV